jgi:hypothetical protein
LLKYIWTSSLPDGGEEGNMKSRVPVTNLQDQTRTFYWLYQEDQEDDFLTGKTPKDLSDAWEEEE